MRLLRAVHRHAAKGDLSLSRERHPCIAVEWNPEEPAQRAIPFDLLPCWAVQADEVRNQNPVRAAFHRLCLFTGMRPGELQRAEWKDLNLTRRVLVLHKTKTGGSIEIPLTLQIVRELRRARDAGRVLYPTSPFVFSGHSKSGHLVNSMPYTDPSGAMSTLSSLLTRMVSILCPSAAAANRRCCARDRM